MRDGKLPKRQYTDEFKIEAIRLSDAVGRGGMFELIQTETGRKKTKNADESTSYAVSVGAGRERLI